MPYTIGSLCTGYGGLDEGVSLALGGDTRTVFYCEREMYAVHNILEKIREGKMDKAPVFTDVKDFPTELFSERPPDILTAGFPCQPFSQAGARAGDEDPRHLFPHIIRIIEGTRPKHVFLENVEGIISAKLKGPNWADPEGTPVLLHVLRELERRGYRATWGIFSASEVGAPHQRKRVFILAELANADSEGLERIKLAGRADSQRWQESNGSATECGTLWPSRPGEPQHDWEPPRTIDGKLNADWVECLMGLPIGWTGTGNRIDRLRLLGNGVVPQTAALAWKTLTERFK